MMIPLLMMMVTKAEEKKKQNNYLAILNTYVGVQHNFGRYNSKVYKFKQKMPCDHIYERQFCEVCCDADAGTRCNYCKGTGWSPYDKCSKCYEYSNRK